MNEKQMNLEEAEKYLNNSLFETLIFGCEYCPTFFPPHLTDNITREMVTHLMKEHQLEPMWIMQNGVGSYYRYRDRCELRVMVDGNFLFPPVPKESDAR